MSDTFKFDGLPSNDFVEVPDTKKRRSSNPQLDALDRLTAKDLKTIIPDSLLDELADEAEQYGVNVDDLINKAIGSAKDIVAGKSGSLDNLLDGVQISVYFDNDQDEDELSGEDDDSELPYELGNLSYLRPEGYATIPVMKDENLYQHFVDKYGSDGSTYLDDNGIENIYLNASTAKVPVEDIEKLVVAEYNDQYIIFYAQPKDSTKYGFFVSVVENPDGKFTLFIPEFRNTYKVLPDGTISLFDLNEDKGYFHLGMDGKAEFLGYNIDMIEFSTAFMIYESKSKCLITPKEFGTIKNCKASVTEDSNYLQIGTITSNESDKAILLKKDAELQLSETEFPLYIYFEDKISKEMLQELSDVFFKVDFNNCPYFDNCELKYNNSHELYVDVN